MRTVTVQLPDSVNLSEAEIQELILANVAGQRSAVDPSATDLTALLGRPLSSAEANDIRHLVGLYYAERATQLVDELWDEKSWTADTMHEWLREHLRTAYGRPAA